MGVHRHIVRASEREQFAVDYGLRAYICAVYQQQKRLQTFSFISERRVERAQSVITK